MVKSIPCNTKRELRVEMAVEDCKKVGQVMAQARKRGGYSQAAVAMYVGVETSVVSSWETGRTTPHMKNFIMWCDALTVAPADALTLAVQN
ncbi:MAG: helix-turn-helix transcriptional regulator [Chloroflexi bacterium]|nr:helix-turn-helix transcriptional regulator [Chloroflexota bacterium]